MALGLFSIANGYIKKTLIIIPTLNESENIENLIYKIQSLHKNVYIGSDDNSNDGTLDILYKLKKLKNLRIVEKNKGIGSAHLCGIRYAYKNNYKICITMDAMVPITLII